MRYSKSWLYTDVLNLLAFLPLFFILPIFMQIYFVIALFLILDNRKWYKLLLFGGVILVLISFINSFDLASVPKFNTFIKLMVSLLLVAVLSQRAMEEKNIYITLAPYLFFGFSVIFFQNLYMLFYSIFLIALFLFFRLLYVIEDFNIAFIKFVKMFIVSIPIVVVLFLIFPRHHAKSPKIGFQSKYVLSGFGDSLTVSDKSVIDSNAVVMEIEFNKVPKEFYFRGVVLDKKVGNRWIKENRYKDILTNTGDKISYTLKQYPTNKKYIFALDTPASVPKKTFLTNTHTLMSKEPLKDILNIKLSSYQNYKLKPVKLSETLLEYDKNRNLKTQKLVSKIKEIKSDEAKLNSLKNLFKAEMIQYTKEPPKFDLQNSVDEFFRIKKGYCVHFASAFAITARMVGLPSRVIKGFLSKKSSMLKNYLVVREKDAHAWVEVYLKKRGWVRVDPTRFAYQSISETNLNETAQEKISPIKLWTMYMRFKIEQWVLYYDSYKQAKLKKLLEKRDFLIKFISVFITMIFFVIATILWLKREIISAEDKIISKLLHNKPRNMTKFEYLKSLKNREIDEINNLYHKIKYYKSNREDLKELKRKVESFKKSEKKYNKRNIFNMILVLKKLQSLKIKRA